MRLFSRFQSIPSSANDAKQFKMRYVPLRCFPARRAVQNSKFKQQE
jgi:hypothetical protein